jgi:small-conductance mechanosensitive channel
VQEIFSTLNSIVSGITPSAIFRAIILLILGFFIGRVTSRAVVKILAKRTTLIRPLLIKRLIFYGIFCLFLIAALQHLGFRLTVLLWAIALVIIIMALALQSSVSNIVSGWFLLGEKPFVLGDKIIIEGSVGKVFSIDFMSIKILTDDNTLLRIPYDIVMKSKLNNLTRFPLIHLTLHLGIACKEDLEKVRKILLGLAHKNPQCLEEPQPSLFILGFSGPTMNLEFSLWTSTHHLKTFKSKIQEEIKQAFDAQQVELVYASTPPPNHL